MIKPKIITIPFEQLVKADWNYKSEGTEAEIRVLAQSILEDNSAGIPAIRELEPNVYELIDGNHRHDAISLLISMGKTEWENVECENFGKITKAQAITIARRRNYKWFDDNLFKYAELLRDEVLPEYPIETLDRFMPEGKQQITDLVEMLDFDFGSYQKSDNGKAPEKKFEIHIKADKWLVTKWEQVRGQMSDYDFAVALLEHFTGEQE